MKNVLYLIIIVFLISCITSEEKHIPSITEQEFIMAIKKSNLGKIDKLIKSGVSVNTLLATGDTVLMLAAGGAYSEVIRDENGMAQMTMQKIKENLKISQILIKHKADLNYINKTGRTALIQAAIMGNLDIVKLLVSVGADVSAKDKSKARAIDYASRLGHKAVVKYLTGINP